MHLGNYHHAPAEIRESSVYPENYIVTLPKGHAEYGYAPGSEFYVGIDSEAVDKGYLTVINPNSDLVAKGVLIAGVSMIADTILFTIHGPLIDTDDEASRRYITNCVHAYFVEVAPTLAGDLHDLTVAAILRKIGWVVL